MLTFVAAFDLSNVVGIRVSGNFHTSPPSLEQVRTFLTTHGPLVYFHPDEEYLPSSVDWFFKNGALLYQHGNESHPVRINYRGSNLPQGGGDDGAFWLDLPMKSNAAEHVKKGNLGSAKGYVHVKPLQSGYTDLAIWLFFPYNGPARAKVFFLDIRFPDLGSHVCDWEHITLRIWDGKLQGIYFSQHKGGHWVIASDLEYANGNKPIVYASHHGHAMFPHGGLVMQGYKQLGFRNYMAKSGLLLDLGAKSEIVSGEYLGIVEPLWLNYLRKWGPKLDYKIVDYLNKVKKLLVFNKLKRKFEKFVNGLPPDVLGQEGPSGPKDKPSWNGEEQV
ncbi:hypothetical protein QQ045_026884 [Rhodiola kirilowii]